ncbi:MAG TPA: glycoside hydrolase family 2 TIM barrel-domain containing protein [Phycisphaerae bacterium]|nr:glycoside hydrolase family 2 TIM barrel-domain containing protein [Phycisphaerae bacterium]
MMRAMILAAVLACFQTIVAAGQSPWAEHPRPDFERAPWVNLNGPWSFAFDPDDAGEKAGWFKRRPGEFEGRIIVPFPWESRLSGVCKPEYKGVAWYAREVTLPDGEGWDGRNVWLIVGACDFEAKIWVNGEPACEHEGGYLPFEFNLSGFGKPGETVTVVIRVVDRTDWEQPIGKQVDRWYTRTSGIWQTVYLEPRSATFIDAFRAETRVGSGTVSYKVTINKPAPAHTVVAVSPDGRFEPAGSSFVHQETTSQVLVKVREPKAWTPDSPVLYPIVLKLTDPTGKTIDEINGYFGLREISVGKAPGGKFNHIQLNGKPIYLLGALHQSFHPDGIYQYPDDAAVRLDYELSKRLGLNFLRIHIKIPTPRELYWADKLGILIMQDMPSFWRYTEQSRQWWQEMTAKAIARDFNHPSVFSWALFNESWGLDDGQYSKGLYSPDRQAWVAKMYWWARKLDPTRLIEDNSPCHYDHVVTDINSWHFYINDYARARDHIAEVVEKTYPGSGFNYAKGYTQGDAPLINSEYGGIGARAGDQDVSWCFKYLTNELRKYAKIGGYVYTELSDIEYEHNGFVNYDRSPKEFGYDFWFPGMTVADLNNPDFVVIDAPPVIELALKQDRQVPVRISHWSDRETKDLQLRWRLDWLDRFGRRYEGQRQQQPAQWRQYDVVEQPAIHVAADHPSGTVGGLLVELVDGERVLARNYVNVLVKSEPAACIEAIDANVLDCRVRPTDYAAWTFDGPLPMDEGVAGQKVAGRGTGAVEYHVRLPANIAFEKLRGMKVLAELAGCAGEAKLDWPARRNDMDYPQTDARKWPTDVRLTLNGHEAARVTLADDPADAAGVLSHHRGHQGAHGQLVQVDVPEDVLKQLRTELTNDCVLRVRWEVPTDAAHVGGLSVYGEQLGAYPVLPTVRVEVEGSHGVGELFTSDVPVAQNRLLAGKVVLLPTAEQGGMSWKYTTVAPGDGWQQPEFKDGSWKVGKAGFGSKEMSNLTVGTTWNVPDIWLRSEFTIDEPSHVVGGQWRIAHDEDVEVYLNGERVLVRAGLTKEYVTVGWQKGLLKSLRPGRNVVAVHCRNPSGGQYVDLGAAVVKAQPGSKSE